MNCRQGDLAVIVRSKLVWPLGMIVRCVEFCVTENGDPGWILDRPLTHGQDVYTSVRDSCLRPIRDPGADAVDEMLIIKPQERVMQCSMII